MVRDSQRDRIKQLLADYILGNLSQEEIIEFKKITSENSKLIEESEVLRSLSQLMPQNPPQAEPPPHLKATTLENASDRDESLSWGSIFANLALVVCTIVLAIENHRLQQNVNAIQEQLVIKENKPWQGISELIVNHFNSLDSLISPVKNESNSPKKSVENLGNKIVLPEKLLKFKPDNLYFIDANLSEIESTTGIRFSYQTNRGNIISFYQLNRDKTSFFPNLNSGYIYITKLDEYNLVLWASDTIIYAIVADLSIEELQELANNVERI